MLIFRLACSLTESDRLTLLVESYLVQVGLCPLFAKLLSFLESLVHVMDVVTHDLEVVDVLV